jgi:hypothetical protein
MIFVRLARLVLTIGLICLKLEVDRCSWFASRCSNIAIFKLVNGQTKAGSGFELILMGLS